MFQVLAFLPVSIVYVSNEFCKTPTQKSDSKTVSGPVRTAIAAMAQLGLKLDDARAKRRLSRQSASRPHLQDDGM